MFLETESCCDSVTKASLDFFDVSYFTEKN